MLRKARAKLVVKLHHNTVLCLPHCGSLDGSYITRLTDTHGLSAVVVVLREYIPRGVSIPVALIAEFEEVVVDMGNTAWLVPSPTRGSKPIKHAPFLRPQLAYRTAVSPPSVPYPDLCLRGFHK